MGWSCAADAYDTGELWTKQCLTQTAIQNQYRGKDGALYFYQTSRTEHRDGAITGTVYRYTPDEQHVIQCGTFRIDGDGTARRYPTSWPFPKVKPETPPRRPLFQVVTPEEYDAYADALKQSPFTATWEPSTLGTPTQSALFAESA